MSSHPDIVLYPHPALASAASARPVDAAMIAAGEALLAVAQSVQAYGLAAAHIGRNEPLIVVSLGDMSKRDYLVMFNPVIESIEGSPEMGTEGSVSLPGIEVQIARAPRAVVRFDGAEGVPQTLDLTGFDARVVQHEIDQMNGIFFLEKLSRLKRDAALRRFGKLRRQGN